MATLSRGRARSWKTRLAPIVLSVAALGCQEFPGPAIPACGNLDIQQSQEDFKAVSPLLERRCGSLDCHGQLARPLRIYGRGGLRLADFEEFYNPDAAQASGKTSASDGNVTTEDEVLYNWRSACALEPELTSQVAVGAASPLELILLRKPLGDERHKGSVLFSRGEVDSTCVACWLAGNPNSPECSSVVADCEAAAAED